MAFQDYQIAAGYNNAGGLQNVEDILPLANNRQTFLAKGWGNIDEGIERERADGTTYTTGFTIITWQLSVLSIEQWAYLQTNYSTGGNSLSGLVTIRTRVTNKTYANYNAVMKLPKLSEFDKEFGIMRNAEIRFVRAEAL